MSFSSVSSVGGASCRADTSNYSVTDDHAPPGIAQQDWDDAKREERLELIQESIRMESQCGGLPSEATSAPSIFSRGTGSSAYSALYRDAPPGISQGAWDEAELGQRLAMIEKSEQQAWVAQTLPQIAEPLPLSMPNLLQPPAIEKGAPFVLRDLTGALSTPKIIPIYTVASGDTLLKIAKKAGVTVDALRNANGLDPANDHRLRVGTKLRLPPRSNTSHSFRKPEGTVEIVRDEAILDTLAENLMKGDLLPMTDNGKYEAACANFVSAVLIKNGLLNENQHTARVTELKNILTNNGWEVIDGTENSKPGDVVIMEKQGHRHTGIIVSNENGTTFFIGSNNNNGRDNGNQRITQQSTNWWEGKGGYTLSVFRQP